MYKIIVGPIRSIVYPPPSKELSDKLYDSLKFRVNGYQYTPRYKQGVWDGFISLYKKREASFPTGLTRRAIKIFHDCMQDVVIEYELNYDPKGTGDVCGLTLMDFQKQAVARAIQQRYGIIKAPVRAGKTAIIGSLISKVDHYPVCVVTFGTDLVVQTKLELEKFLNRPVGFFSEGVLEESDIVVTSYQALVRVFNSNQKEPTGKTSKRNSKVKQIIQDTKLLILDECHYVYTKKNENVFAHFQSAGYRIGLSGTPQPDNKTRIEVEAGIGPIISSVEFEKLIEKGRIAKPIIIMYKMPSQWYQEYITEYKDVYEANVVRNQQRNLFIADLVKKLNLKNKSCFITVRKKYHGEILRELIPDSVYVYGDIDADIRKKLYDRLNSGELKCIISTVGKVGLNIPNLDVVINAEGLEAETTTIQKMRSLTASKDKDYGIVIDFIDHGRYIYEHSKNRQQLYKSLKGFELKDVKVPFDYFNKKEDTNE